MSAKISILNELASILTKKEKRQEFYLRLCTKLNRTKYINFSRL
jgi:hypothetical protein